MAQDTTKSKWMVAGFVALILIGWGAWNAWDFWGVEGLNPKRVKTMAKTYETECYEVHQDVRTCKRHIGTWHRRCLKDHGIDRAGPEEPKRPIRYDQEAYASCMRAKRIADLGK